MAKATGIHKIVRDSFTLYGRVIDNDIALASYLAARNTQSKADADTPRVTQEQLANTLNTQFQELAAKGKYAPKLVSQSTVSLLIKHGTFITDDVLSTATDAGARLYSPLTAAALMPKKAVCKEMSADDWVMWYAETLPELVAEANQKKAGGKKPQDGNGDDGAPDGESGGARDDALSAALKRLASFAERSGMTVAEMLNNLLDEAEKDMDETDAITAA